MPRQEIVKASPFTKTRGRAIAEVGQWYWVKDDDKKGTEWFGCITHVGSNFVELESPHSHHHGHRVVRVHFDNFQTELRREAVRENERQARDWRNRNPSHYKRYRPNNDPGPGLVSTMRRWKSKTHRAVFAWMRERQSYRWWGSDAPIQCSIEVPADQLLNVSAYTPGDYKQFFNDPRTRENYLQWAPMLLAAEEYHAGNIVLGQPSGRGQEWRKSRRRN